MKRFYLFLFALLGLMGTTTVSAASFQEGLVRFVNKRTNTACLTTTQSGKAVGAKRDVKQIGQVWVLLKSGSGYTVRSANTGEYLQAEFASPANSKTTLYIQQSPNDGNYFNISSKSDFSGQTCLNLNGDGKGIYKWSYSGDAGSDWLIETVDNFDLDEIRQKLLAMDPYVGELKDGAYYRILSYYGMAITAGDPLSTKNVDANNFNQYWQLTKNGSGWNIQAVVTQQYIQPQSSLSTPFPLGKNKSAFSIARVNDDWDNRWTIFTSGQTAGLHDASSQGHNVVRWSTNADASEWHFEEVTLSQEDIDKARAEQNGFEELVANKTKLQSSLDNLFEDKACTTLKADIQALSDDALAANEDFKTLNADMQALVLKVKNDTWKQFTNTKTNYTAGYEKFFRIADYKIYSHFEKMCNADNFTMSNSFGKLSGPTGIVANPNDIIYIYVDENAKTGCTLQVEAVGTDAVPGDRRSGATTNLKAGLNLVRYSEQKMLYIFYQLDDPKKLLANYPDIKIHIEGGQLQGYWDATRGMTNADWKLLQQDLLKASPYLNLKTEHLVFCMDAALVKQAEPNEMEGLMHIWETVPVNEERYMGVEDFEGRYRNVWNCFSIDYNYMFATTNGTYYNNSTLPTIMNYKNMSTAAGNLWGPSHEMGHNHQASINVIGATESSNNMFSNINTFESGIQTSRRYYPHQNYEYMANQTPWLERNIWMTTGMFYQLYLYFHVQHHDDNFLPNLFRQMRKKPLNKWSGPGNGGPTSYGKDDYLHLAKMICDVAQADLSEFFEAYGMFIPVKMLHVGDYSEYDVTTTQQHINSAKAYMQKYEKKLGNIMFIDDRVIQKDADAENIFGCVPASDGKKRANEEYPFLMKSAKASYVGGDYESFTADAEPVTDDYYTLNRTGKVITFQGTKNYAGHKFYDADGNLIWATNTQSATLPDCVLKLGIENVRIMTAMYDMSDRLCTDTKPDDGVNDLRMGTVPATNQMFDLTGRRVNNIQQSGLYIVNGKKVLVK